MPGQRNLPAMTIDSHTHEGGASRGSINRIVKTLANVLFIFILSSFSALLCGATVYHSDGSAASVQALHNKALDGDTITLPPGTFMWSRPVGISKAIRLQGAGSGRIIGNANPLAVGTGSKTFTTTRTNLPIAVGQTLRVAKMPALAKATMLGTHGWKAM